MDLEILPALRVDTTAVDKFRLKLMYLSCEKGIDVTKLTQSELDEMCQKESDDVATMNSMAIATSFWHE